MKKILLGLLLSSSAMFGQVHLNVGVVDIQNRMDGASLGWNVGYTKFFNRVGFGASYREASFYGDNYGTIELNIKQRVVDERIYRFEWGIGAGYNLDEFDVHPISYVRNSIRIDEGVWVNLDFDNAYRNSKDWNGGGWRFETYLLVGFSMDLKWQSRLKKIKRFY